MRLFISLLFGAFLLISHQAQAQEEYLGYSPAVLEAMAKEGDDLEKVKIDRFLIYLDRLDELRESFYELYDDPSSDENLKRRVQERLEALATLKISAADYRKHHDKNELGEAAVSLVMYKQALEVLGLRDYFENMYAELEGAEQNEDQLANSTVYAEETAGYPEYSSEADLYNVWLGLAPVYNYHVNSGYGQYFLDNVYGPIFGVSENLMEDASGGLGLAVNLGFSYRLSGPLSFFLESSFISQSVAYDFSVNDTSLQFNYNEENSYRLSNVGINLGLNYFYQDFDFKLGLQYLAIMSATQEYSISDDFDSVEGEIDLGDTDFFASSQTSLFAEVSYDIYDLAVADEYLGVQVYLRPHLSFTNLMQPTDMDPFPEDYTFKIYQVHFGIRLQY